MEVVEQCALFIFCISAIMLLINPFAVNPFKTLRLAEE